MKPRIALIVLDGWGYREQKDHNAIAQANTPFFDYLWELFPHSLLQAGGLAVGLPEGEMGNSEVGHMTIGAGRVLDTDVVRIGKSFETGEIKQNQALQTLFTHIREHDSVLHIQGLVSPGGIHSHSSHLYGLLRLAKEEGIKKIVLHVFTDGRDTPPQSAAEYIKELENVLEELGVGYIASASGRFYAMDRDNNWERIERAEKAIFEAEGKVIQGKKVSETLEALYKEGVWDEHLEPLVFLDDNGLSYEVKQNDGILFFNFRADRARQMTRRILQRGKLKNLCFVALTEYDATMECLVAFPPLSINTTLAGEIAKNGLHQIHIAETEKYAHATYFLNGKKEMPHEGEKHILIESRKDVQTHNLAPQMRAKEITDAAIEQMQGNVDFLFLNYANADMVGHTADWSATIQAVEEIDIQLKRLFEVAQKNNYLLFITADHGNAEILFNTDTNQKHTAHTNNPVPCVFTETTSGLHDGTLADVAPTLLSWYEVNIPNSMGGKNLLF